MTNKLGIVIGAAAIAVVAGCKDPNYVRMRPSAQNEVKDVPPAQTVTPVTPVVLPADVTPAENVPEPVVLPQTPEIEVEVVDVPPPPPSETVPPPPPVVLPPPPPPAPAMTEYIVQRNDTLFLISKRYNIKLDAIRKANPGLKGDNIRLGQKIMLPGTVAVGEQKVPAGAILPPPPKPEYKPYDGATKEYVVKSGDTLGGIAYPNGINIRQLKEMNGLTSDFIRAGQKLKIPATAVVKAPSAPAKPKALPPPPQPAVQLPPVPAPDVNAGAEDVNAAIVSLEAPVETVAPAATEPAPVEAAGEDFVTYIVQEGEDVTAISIAFGVDPAVIRELNNMGDQDQVKPNQVIKLPPDAQ